MHSFVAPPARVARPTSRTTSTGTFERMASRGESPIARDPPRQNGSGRPVLLPAGERLRLRGGRLDVGVAQSLEHAGFAVLLVLLDGLDDVGDGGTRHLRVTSQRRDL